MRILTISNLYPRPDQPQRGLFNAQQFRAMAELVRAEHGPQGASQQDAASIHSRPSSVANLCLVPEWRIWRWRQIRQWTDPYGPDMATRYVPVFYLPLVGRNWNWRFYGAALQNQAHWFAGRDAVLATWLYPDAVAVACRTGTKRLWVKAHGSDRFRLQSAFRGRRVRMLGRQARGILCNSEFMKGRLIETGLPAAKLHVVRNGVNAEVFRYRSRDCALALLGEEMRSAIDKTGGRRIVLFAGNLVPVKGPDLLLAAWAEVVRGRQDPPLLAVLGSGSMRGGLERDTHRLGISDSVMFLGSQPHSQIALCMNVAACLVVPSRSESMPNVVMEALASGVPVVAADVGGCREILASEPAGLVVPPNDPAALGRAVSAMMDLKVDRTSMAARHAASFSWEANAREILRLMSE